MDHLTRWQAATKKPAKKRKPGVVLEKDIQKAIQQAFRLKGIALYATDAGSAGMRAAMSEGARGYSSLPSGFPDLIGCAPGGRFVALEVKRPGNTPTELQDAFLALFRSKGAIAFWADSVESALRQFQEAA